MTGYQVPARETEVELRFKNSRFIGSVGRAETVEEAKAFIGKIRQRYPDASHHVYAFAVGYGATVTHGMSDDGEPSGTAGRPALAVVQGAGLGDLVVVVTRYFGGTKLGTGGLVRAYTGTAQAVLEETPREEKVDLVFFSVELAYEQHALCRKLIEDQGATVEEEAFGASVQLDGSIREELFEGLCQVLRDATSGRSVPEVVASD